MSALETDVTKQFYILLEGAWADVQTVLNENDADRIDWIRAIRNFRTSGSGILKPPFAVVAWGRKSETTKGGICNQEYEWPVSVALVVSIASTEATENYLMDQMELLKSALLGATMASQKFMLLGMPSTDYNPRSQANEILVKANLPYMAAVMEITLRTGITP